MSGALLQLNTTCRLYCFFTSWQLDTRWQMEMYNGTKVKERKIAGRGSIQETKHFLRDTETAHALRSQVLMEGYPGSLSWVIHVQPGTPAVPQVLYGRISSLFHIITILSSDA
jgi:hypothetical protein